MIVINRVTQQVCRAFSGSCSSSRMRQLTVQMRYGFSVPCALLLAGNKNPTNKLSTECIKLSKSNTQWLYIQGKHLPLSFASSSFTPLHVLGRFSLNLSLRPVTKLLEIVTCCSWIKNTKRQSLQPNHIQIRIHKPPTLRNPSKNYTFDYQIPSPQYLDKILTK